MRRGRQVALGNKWGETTKRIISEDMGKTWGSIEDIGNQVGAIHYPTLYPIGEQLLLMGREAIGLLPSDDRSATKQTTLFFSYDKGKNFKYPLLIENYNQGRAHDGGYGHALLLSENKIFLTYCMDTDGDYLPEIKTAYLHISPKEEKTNGLYISEGFSNNPANREVIIDKNIKKYEVNFCLSNEETTGGDQFELDLVDRANKSLVSWHLPSNIFKSPNQIIQATIQEENSTHIISNHWEYNVEVCGKTILDEDTKKHNSYLYDNFGNLIGQVENANFSSSNASSLAAIQVGSGSTQRATKTTLNSVYVRYIYPHEPVIEILPKNQF